MKTSIQEEKISNEYPRIMFEPDTGDVVLFRSRREGMVIHSGFKCGSSPVGEIGVDWDAESAVFIPFTGKITLSN